MSEILTRGKETYEPLETYRGYIIYRVTSKKTLLSDWAKHIPSGKRTWFSAGLTIHRLQFAYSDSVEALKRKINNSLYPGVLVTEAD